MSPRLQRSKLVGAKKLDADMASALHGYVVVVVIDRSMLELEISSALASYNNQDFKHLAR